MNENETVDEIREQMETVRCHLSNDVDGMVRSARNMLDWQSVVRRFPWVCVGAAAAAGYLLIPRRVEIISPDPETLLDLAKRNKLVVKAKPSPRPRDSLISTLFNLAANAAVRGATSYVSQQAGRLAGGRRAESRVGDER